MLFLSSKKHHQLFILSFFAIVDTTDSFVSHKLNFSENSMIAATATAATGYSSSHSPTSVLGLTAIDDSLDKNIETENDICAATSADVMDKAAPMDPRSCILEVGASAGKLCCVANQLVKEANESLERETDPLLTQALVEIFASLWLTTKALRLDWVKSIRSKMALNAKKYPVEHCKVRETKRTH